MPTPAELEAKFWKSVKSDMTMMLGLEAGGDAYPRPMTGQLEEDHDTGPIWFFTSTETELARELADGSADGIATFVSKGHDIYATVHGTLVIDNDRAMIDKLWNKYVAAWFEGGKTDPKLTLLRFDAAQAEIWLDGSSLIAGIKMLFGSDPKEDYKDNVAKVNL